MRILGGGAGGVKGNSDLDASASAGTSDGEGEGENTGIIDFWCLYFMLKIGWYIQAVWSMRAVVLRKNLGKCVISPLMEHRRKAILLVPSHSLFRFPLVLPLFWDVSMLDSPLPPSLLFMLVDVSISLPPLHLSTSQFHPPPSPSSPIFLLKEWLSPQF